jgi:hypothetical protein
MELLIWIQEHEAELLALGAALWAFVSIVVRLTPSPEDDAALGRLRAAAERISFLQPRDGRGTFSVPGRPARRQADPEDDLTG